MESGFFGLMELLDFDAENILFQQRESGQARTPFEMEQQVLQFVAAGNVDEMVAYYQHLLGGTADFKVSVGKLSRDKLRHFKYMAVSAIALLCRVAIINGAPEAVAYSMSDEAIQRLDRMPLPEAILMLLLQMVYSYTELVGQSKENASFSKPVRDGVEFIVANLHSKIALEDLVQGTGYTKDYYAKLFKKEVGMPVSDFILDRRVQEAKKLLLEGKSSREIAYVLQFCSQSYFIQQFKHVAGMTPREYKLLHRHL